jgi:hypothetical protein
MFLLFGVFDNPRNSGFLRLENLDPKVSKKDQGQVPASAIKVGVNKSSAESAEQHSPGRKPWDHAWSGNKP